MYPSEAIEEKYPILWKWASHDSESFHDFTTEEASLIRSLLLKWYRSNRRKLPWRGDKGPYNGSTAGIANANTNGKKKKTIPGQKSIQSFFATTTTNNKSEDQILMEENEEPAIPISGYSVWVSEIMLQQTRVEAVIPYYLKWMKSFPTVQHLANATEDEVNAHWAGLGFYRRARLLHQGAKYVATELNGVMPEEVQDLLKISGIGPYTANAIASIAFDKCVPVVDGNVCRVLARLKGVANHIKSPIFKDDKGWFLAEQIVKAGDGKSAGEVNQALMELGATYCSPSATGIDQKDPLKDFYMSTKLGIEMDRCIKDSQIGDFEGVRAVKDGVSRCLLCDKNGISTVFFKLSDCISLSLGSDSTPLGFSRKDTAAKLGHSHFPIDPPKKAKREEVFSVAAMVHTGSGEEKWLMVKRKDDGLLAGQWEFPANRMWFSGVDGKGSDEIPVFDLKAIRSSIRSEMSNYDWRQNDIAATLQGIWLHDSIVVSSLESPLEHIFSHIRWTLYCDYADITAFIPDSILHGEIFTNDGRECRFFSEDEMKNVGITSSVKKCLLAIKAQSKNRKRKLK